MTHATSTEHLTITSALRTYIRDFIASETARGVDPAEISEIAGPALLISPASTEPSQTPTTATR